MAKQVMLKSLVINAESSGSGGVDVVYAQAVLPGWSEVNVRERKASKMKSNRE